MNDVDVVDVMGIEKQKEMGISDLDDAKKCFVDFPTSQCDHNLTNTL